MRFKILVPFFFTFLVGCFEKFDTIFFQDLTTEEKKLIGTWVCEYDSIPFYERIIFEKSLDVSTYQNNYGTVSRRKGTFHADIKLGYFMIDFYFDERTKESIYNIYSHEVYFAFFDSDDQMRLLWGRPVGSGIKYKRQ